MIVIKVELWPYGYEKYKRILGLQVIANDGTGDRKLGNYNAFVKTVGHDDNQFSARIEGFDRIQDVWELVRQILNKRHMAQGEEQCQPNKPFSSTVSRVLKKILPSSQ